MAFFLVTVQIVICALIGFGLARMLTVRRRQAKLHTHEQQAAPNTQVASDMQADAEAASSMQADVCQEPVRAEQYEQAVPATANNTLVVAEADSQQRERETAEVDSQQHKHEHDMPAHTNPEELPLTDDMRTVFDYEKFERALLHAPNLVAELRMFVEDIRTREAHNGTDRLGQELGLPGDVELFAAVQIEESGILQPGMASYRLRAIRLTRSQMFYIRIEQPRVPLAVREAALRLESALNRLHFTMVYFDDIARVRIEDAYLLNQRIEQVFPSQVAAMVENEEPAHSGEWDARLMLGAGIESFQLPYRLVCEYRMNLKEHLAAISINLTPPELFNASNYVHDIDRVVPTTSEMRARSASDYALRLGIMVAAFAFQCSSAINEVYIRGMMDDAKHQRCYYSVCFDRTRFSAIRLEELDTLPWHYRCFAARFRMTDGILQPINPSFSLDEERFCPKERFEEVELSHRVLSRKTADVLGTYRVSGLAIDENAQRRQVAETIARNLTESTEQNVRTILAAASSNPHPSVQAAATRTVQKLIDGSLAEDNVYAIEKEFVSGDELNVALQLSLQNLNRQDAHDIIHKLAPLLKRIDARGLYQDSEQVVHRHFNSYAERALYNRNHTDKQKVELTPDAYYNAHLLLSMAYLSIGNNDRGFAYARRASEINPMDANPRLLLTQCLESQDRWVEAIEQLQQLLKHAHTPEAAGTAYYHMAHMQLHEGRPDLAEACFYKSLQFSSSVWLMVRYALEMLQRNNHDTVHESRNFTSAEELDATLRQGGIEVVSVEQACKSAYECGKAAMDANLFPVARSLARMLASLSGDDAVFDLVRSIESSPDR